MLELKTMIELTERVNFLSNVHLFYGLSSEQLSLVAARLEEQTFKPGEIIAGAEKSLCALFLIYSGEVWISTLGRNRQQARTYRLVAGDYFGEKVMSRSARRLRLEVRADKETLLLVLNEETLRSLLKQVRVLQRNLRLAVNTHRLEQTGRFKWIPEDEIIYYLARKHGILLLEAMFRPLMVFFPAFLLLLYLLIAGPLEGLLRLVSLGITSLITLVAAAWGLWNYLDWGNDYYIVTNRRVIWLEKVIGLYDSRNETPLSAIQRLNVQTDFWGRQLHYGDISIRTIVGSTLTLRNLPYPQYAAALIEEQWRRVQQLSRHLEEEEMKKIIRERLEKGPALARPKSVIAKPQPKQDPYKGHHTFSNLFRLRFEQQTTVTYRKHIVVLLKQTGVPFVLMLAWMVVVVVLGPVLFSALGWLPALCAWSLVFFILFAWWVYQYVDWSNDIFQVTPDQILDIDKTPFGQVSSDIAALDNILSIEYERKGLLELIFNYGDVRITIGGGKQMVFEDVANPAAVQDDIERRRLERLASKEKEKERAERERFADWFAAYYHTERAFRQERPSSPAPAPEPPAPAEPPPPKKIDQEW